MQETPQEYRKSMLAHSEGRDALKLQAAAPGKLERMLKGVASSKLRKRPAPGKWSVAEIVAHLADSEIARAWRMRMILSAPGTTLQAFDQDQWAVALHYDKRDARESLKQFRALREANLALLETLTPDQWKHFGVHQERGEEFIDGGCGLQLFKGLACDFAIGVFF